MRRRSSLCTIALATAALAASAPALAQSRAYGPEYDYARVLRVEPVVDVVEHPVSREECWDERVTYREPVRRDAGRDRAPAVLGGIVGGVIGNQFGSGNGRDAATVAGAALGYSLARDSQRRHGSTYQGSREVTRVEPRCTTRTEYEREERVTGYEVTYRYHGRTYTTMTDYDPGERLRVEVDMDVRPAY